MKPLCIDGFCGLGGWAEGFLAEGWDVIGFDVERHVYGEHQYPGQLVIQNVLSLHGSQFKNVDCLVFSPPCQFFSYTAMPWSRAKALAAKVRADPVLLEKELALFNACFRIQREACEAAGRHIPMVVENVKGAQPWVGRARWNYGSFYLFGDVPALMPVVAKRSVMKAGISHRNDGSTNFHGQKVPGFRFDGSGKSFQSASVEHTGVKAPGMNWSDQTKRGQDFTRLAGQHAGRKNDDGRKMRDQDGYDRTHPNAFGRKAPRTSSKGKARKRASAMIAKIPLPLSRHIARCFKNG